MQPLKLGVYEFGLRKVIDFYRDLSFLYVKSCKMKKLITTKVVLDSRYEKKNSDTFSAKLRVTFQKKQVYFQRKYSFTEKTWAKMHSGRPDQHPH